VSADRSGPAPFRNRHDAGKALAARLRREAFVAPVVLALPRGGVPVAYEIATALGAPLDVFVARKIGAPGAEEFGIGAIAEGTDELMLSETARSLGLSARRLSELAKRERAEVERRVAVYRGSAPAPEVAGRDLILVDDGLATGVTAEAALRALRRRHPRRLVLAVPVCARESAERLASIATQIVCLVRPADFHAVGAWYEDFAPTSDGEVVALLQRARAATSNASPDPT
jgi:putative phosphoribosyl transferase